MERIWTALIIYECQQVKPCICLANFLRMCGFIVDKSNIELPYEQNWERLKEYYIVINLSSVTIKEYSGNLIDLHSQFRTTGTECLKSDDEKCKFLIQKMEEEFEKNRVVEVSIIEYFNKFLEIYLGYDLRKNEYNCSRFFYDEELMRTAYDMFYYAEKKLESLCIEYYKVQNTEVLPFVLYTRAYCMWRMSEIENNLNKYKLYDTKRFLDFTERIIRKEERLGTIYYLMGCFLESDNQWETAYQCYKQFLKCHGNKIYANAVWYRCGKVIEAIADLESANQYYQKAYDLNQENYQAQYKVAVFLEFYRKEYESALKEYQAMISIFENLIEKKVLQPREYEYLFKLYFRCGRLLLIRKSKAKEAMEYFNKTEHLVSLGTNKMQFVERFYGEDTASTYWNKMVKRLPLYQIKINKQEAEWQQKNP